MSEWQERQSDTSVDRAKHSIDDPKDDTCKIHAA